MLDKVLYHGPPYEILHEEYAKRGKIDGRSPVQTSGAITVRAPVQRVWELLMDLPHWSAIDPTFQDVRLESLAAVDAYFRFSVRNFPIRARFAVIRPQQELTWTGVSLWFKAVDVHRVEPTDDEGARLYVAESLAGRFAPLFISSERLRSQHESWLGAFKRAAENPVHDV